MDKDGSTSADKERSLSPSRLPDPNDERENKELQLDKSELGPSSQPDELEESQAESKPGPSSEWAHEVESQSESKPGPSFEFAQKMESQAESKPGPFQIAEFIRSQAESKSGSSRLAENGTFRVESEPGPSSLPTEASISMEVGREEVRFYNPPQTQYAAQDNSDTETVASRDSSASFGIPTTGLRSRLETSAFWRFFDWRNLSVEQRLFRWALLETICLALVICILYGLFRLFKYLTGFYKRSEEI